MSQPYPPSRHANYMLGVLLAAYILSFIDRNVLAILVAPIRQQFEISDFQFSLLHGWAFTLFYIVLGVPIGWLADRFSRRWIIIVGVSFWSLMTALCGFARSFGSLFLVRVGVGVGEATLSPAAYSLMSDYFPPERLRWATSVFAMGITLGTGASYMVGGYLFEFFSTVDLSHIALFADVQPWQATFITVGLAGFVVVALLALVREPPRQRLAGEAGRAGSVRGGDRAPARGRAPLRRADPRHLDDVGDRLRQHCVVPRDARAQSRHGEVRGRCIARPRLHDRRNARHLRRGRLRGVAAAARPHRRQHALGNARRTARRGAGGGRAAAALGRHDAGTVHRGDLPALLALRRSDGRAAAGHAGPHARPGDRDRAVRDQPVRPGIRWIAGGRAHGLRLRR
ncbi:MAG: MFS transporter [Gammaproteobacteria bacterium]|nr:MFS transporter [Gammaproteobacteria bacterium]